MKKLFLFLAVCFVIGIQETRAGFWDWFGTWHLGLQVSTSVPNGDVNFGFLPLGDYSDALNMFGWSYIGQGIFYDRDACKHITLELTFGITF